MSDSQVTDSNLEILFNRLQLNNTLNLTNRLVMARFVLEVVDAVINVAGSDRVGLRLSPAAYFNMMHHPDDVKVFYSLLQQLKTRDLAYVHTGMFDDDLYYEELDGTVTSFLRKFYQGNVCASGGYSAKKAANAISKKNI